MVRAMESNASTKKPSIKAGLQNKSLEPLAEENKSADEATDEKTDAEQADEVTQAANIEATEVRSAPLADIPDADLPETVTVRILHHVTVEPADLGPDADEPRDLVPGKEEALPVRLAQRLVSTRRARLVETDTES